jgi:hypothetical protein
MSAVHEDFSRAAGHGGGSDRNFGLVFTGAFLFFGLWPLHHGKPIRPWCLAMSAVVLCIALARPSLLHIPNRLWTKLGALMGKIMSPIVTGALFFLVFTPFAIVLKWMGKDPLGISIDRNAGTYWTPRNAAEKPPSMTNQF